jgi:uncharacterized protein
MRAFLALALSLVVSAALAQGEITKPQPTLPQKPLIIETTKGLVRFTVEMATTWPQQETGLMFRKVVAPNQGMLFDFGKDDPVSFWMKNTLIPLDMLFIKKDGRIARIAANAKPLSTDGIPSYEPVRAVLEIAGGRAAELGLKPGDLVRNAAFGNGP